MLDNSSDSDSDSDSDSFSEEEFMFNFLDNLQANLHTEEAKELRDFYISYIEGCNEEYQNIMKEMASSLGLDINGIAKLSFDTMLSVDSENWLKALNLMKNFPKELIIEDQERIHEYYEEVKDYDNSTYQKLLTNLEESNFDEMPLAIRNNIEFSKSKLDSDYSEAYLSYLKATWIVTGKAKAKQEEFERITELEVEISE
ncbi:MAG: hypothetical protein AB8G05_13620 [Oligoflexales bacterium]